MMQEQVILQNMIGVILENWHHVTGVYNNSLNTAMLYLDGVNVVNVSSTDIEPWVDKARIGDLVDSGDSEIRFFNGKIDDVRVYNDAISLTEISQIYNSGSGTEDQNIGDQN